MMPLETNLDRIAARVAPNRDDYAAFGHYIDIMWEREGRSDAELDALVDAIAAAILPFIDCTACANCCRAIAVGLTPEDMLPLAAVLESTPQRITTDYVDRKAGARWGEWGVFHESPCPLLRGKRCSVYDSRPQSCRDYPAFTPDFRWLKDEIIRGAGQCPIIFNVIERLKDRLGW
jgi:Fe-S-cluster containining protein